MLKPVNLLTLIFSFIQTEFAGAYDFISFTF